MIKTLFVLLFCTIHCLHATQHISVEQLKDVTEFSLSQINRKVFNPPEGCLNPQELLDVFSQPTINYNQALLCAITANFFVATASDSINYFDLRYPSERNLLRAFIRDSRVVWERDYKCGLAILYSGLSRDIVDNALQDEPLASWQWNTETPPTSRKKPQIPAKVHAADVCAPPAPPMDILDLLAESLASISHMSEAEFSAATTLQKQPPCPLRSSPNSPAEFSVRTLTAKPSLEDMTVGEYIQHIKQTVLPSITPPTSEKALRAFTECKQALSVHHKGIVALGVCGLLLLDAHLLEFGIVDTYVITTKLCDSADEGLHQRLINTVGRQQYDILLKKGREHIFARQNGLNFSPIPDPNVASESHCFVNLSVQDHELFNQLMFLEGCDSEAGQLMQFAARIAKTSVIKYRMNYDSITYDNIRAFCTNSLSLLKPDQGAQAHEMALLHKPLRLNTENLPIGLNAPTPLQVSHPYVAQQKQAWWSHARSENVQPSAQAQVSTHPLDCLDKAAGKEHIDAHFLGKINNSKDGEAAALLEQYESALKSYAQQTKLLSEILCDNSANDSFRRSPKPRVLDQAHRQPQHDLFTPIPADQEAQHPFTSSPKPRAVDPLDLGGPPPVAAQKKAPAVLLKSEAQDDINIITDSKQDPLARLQSLIKIARICKDRGITDLAPPGALSTISCIDTSYLNSDSAKMWLDSEKECRLALRKAKKIQLA